MWQFGTFLRTARSARTSIARPLSVFFCAIRSSASPNGFPPNVPITNGLVRARKSRFRPGHVAAKRVQRHRLDVVFQPRIDRILALRRRSKNTEHHEQPTTICKTGSSAAHSPRTGGSTSRSANCRGELTLLIRIHQNGWRQCCFAAHRPLPGGGTLQCEDQTEVVHNAILVLDADAWTLVVRRRRDTHGRRFRPIVAVAIDVVPLVQVNVCPTQHII